MTEHSPPTPPFSLSFSFELPQAPREDEETEDGF